LPDLTEKVIEAVLDWFPGPIAYGLRSGHVSRSNVTLPFGVEARLTVIPEKETVNDTNTAELHIGSRATRLTTS
jgi:muramoyltetrapeptide carboxypeptidase